ncbi:MAG TPA: IMP cyclohydrolase [Candidatus Sulfotelmatobacter sp.]|nr:IMP cyclohydrolase [Candidatus Sulfotelmatobacter sp.]
MPELQIEQGQMEIYGNMTELRDNSYPGRVAMMGVNIDGQLAIQAYAIMGRSTGSRTRIFVDEGLGSVRTVAPGKTPEEMAETENAALIYYQASISGEGVHVISNGAQTPYVHEAIVDGKDLDTAVKEAPVLSGVDLSQYEPDEPNFTPRITGVIDLREGAPTPFGLAVVRKDSSSGEPRYETHMVDDIDKVPLGVGFGIQTYLGDDNPLPSFDLDPYAFPFDNDAVSTAQRIWGVLNRENRVALLTRSINLETGAIEETCIINSPPQ